MCAFFCRLFALLFGRSVVLFFVSSPQPYVSYGLLLYKASVPNQHFLLFSPSDLLALLWCLHSFLLSPLSLSEMEDGNR